MAMTADQLREWLARCAPGLDASTEQGGEILAASMVGLAYSLLRTEHDHADALRAIADAVLGAHAGYNQSGDS